VVQKKIVKERRMSIWNPPAVDRRTFDLSPQRPMLSDVHLHTQKQNASFDMHWELELGVVCSGAMRRDYENYSCVMNPGDVWLCGMWEPHRLAGDGDALRMRGAGDPAADACKSALR
jgi:hypothetical protein